MRRLLLALCALTLLSGCGGGVDPSLLAAAVHRTQEAGGAEIAFQWTYEFPDREEPVVMLGSGVEDAKGQRAHVTAEHPITGGRVEAIGDGMVMYMHFDEVSDEIGKEWVKLDLERTNDALGIDMSALERAGQGTTEYLDWLRHVSDGVTDEGREQVRGTETTHYSTTVDLTKVPVQNLDRLVELMGQSQIPVDVWIDDDQRVRRFEVEMTLPGDGEDTRMAMVAEYVRFGVPVDIDIPDEDDVFDATDLTVESLRRELD